MGRTFYDAEAKPIRFDGVTLDITERRLIEQALHDNDRRKDEFLAMLAHELRNPLAPIRHAAQVLKLRGTIQSQAEWAGQVIERQAQHLSRLVDDLLDVSRITRGKITLQRETVDLSMAIDRAIEANQPLADARGQRLTVTHPTVPLRVEGDATRLVQVVSNLLNNAIKYTPAGGQIWIAAEADHDHAVVRVRDDGAGIAAALLPTIFDLFSQADQSLDRAQGGLGIGLTVVQSIVDMHGGTVTARSAGEGHGSEFVVTLPLSGAASSVAATAQTPAEDGGPPQARGLLKVLVIEDNNDAADVLAFLLRSQGHEVMVALDGAEGLDLAREFVPDVVLCDLGLPRVDGHTVARQLRAAPATAGVRLVALSGYGQPEDKRRARDAGFDDYLVKPAEPNVLLALFDSLRQERS